MSDSTIRDLFRSLEVTLHERLRTIEDVIRAGAAGTTGGANTATMEGRISAMEARLSQVFTEMTDKTYQLRQHIDQLQGEITALRGAIAAAPRATSGVSPLIPTHPLEGIEIVPKREVVIPDTTLSMENRLLLNKKARKALEAEEMGEQGIEEHPELDGSENEIVESDGEEVDGGVEEEVEEGLEEVEEELEEEVAEEEVEEVQLEEFEYKGSTYYRDGDGNVFMTDEDGALMDEPIGVWNEAKQRIVVKKASAAA